MKRSRFIGFNTPFSFNPAIPEILLKYSSPYSNLLHYFCAFIANQ